MAKPRRSPPQLGSGKLFESSSIWFWGGLTDGIRGGESAYEIARYARQQHHMPEAPPLHEPIEYDRIRHFAAMRGKRLPSMSHEADPAYSRVVAETA